MEYTAQEIDKAIRVLEGTIALAKSGSWTGGQVAVEMVRAHNVQPALVEALEMVRDADEDCKRDGLKTMPPMARAKIDAALKLARSET